MKKKCRECTPELKCLECTFREESPKDLQYNLIKQNHEEEQEALNRKKGFRPNWIK